MGSVWRGEMCYFEFVFIPRGRTRPVCCPRCGSLQLDVNEV